MAEVDAQNQATIAALESDEKVDVCQRAVLDADHLRRGVVSTLAVQEHANRVVCEEEKKTYAHHFNRWFDSSPVATCYHAAIDKDGMIVIRRLRQPKPITVVPVHCHPHRFVHFNNSF